VVTGPSRQKKLPTTLPAPNYALCHYNGIAGGRRFFILILQLMTRPLYYRKKTPPFLPVANEKKGGCTSGLRQRENSTYAGNRTRVLQAQSQPTVHGAVGQK